MSQRQRPEARRPGSVPTRAAAPRSRSSLRRVGRIGLPQLAFGLMAALVVCSLVAGTLGSAILDARERGGSEDDARNVPDEESPVIQEQRDRIAANPSDAAAMALLADLLANEGQLTEAVSWYERALAINPNDVSVRLNLAQELATGGKYADAEFHYRRVLEIEPNNALAIFYLAELYQNWQAVPGPRIAEAIVLYQRLIGSSPQSVLAERAAAQLAALGVATPLASPSSSPGASAPTGPATPAVGAGTAGSTAAPGPAATGTPAS